MGFFKTLATGYGIMFKEFNRRFAVSGPKFLSGTGTGLMMIGSAVMAKTGMKDDVKKVIAEANAAVDEVKKSVENEKKTVKVRKVFKAKAVKGWKIVKVFWKGEALVGAGAVCNATAIGWSASNTTKAVNALGALGATFAGYRASVREDLGEEADLRYMTGQKHVNRGKKKDSKGETTEEVRGEDDGIYIKKDPNAFRFWFSKETCPSLWYDNLDLRINTLKWVEDTLTRKLQGAGHVDLNEQRREFGGLIPAKMDVDIGGIFGKVLKPGIPIAKQYIDLHFRDDKEFMEGRTDGCWIIFDCDPEPLFGKINNKIPSMEQ